MAYTPANPNAYDTNLIPVEIRAEYFKETLLLSPLSMFMGNNSQAIIQVRNLNDGSGLTSDFTFSRNIDYKNPIIGYDQISGKGALMEFYTDRVTVDQQAIPDRLYGVELTKLSTPVKVFDRMKPLLQEAHNQNLVYSLLASATIGSYAPTGVPGAYVAPTATGPRTNRYVYGFNRVSDNNISAGIDAMIAPGPGTNAAPGDGLSVRHIRKLRNMAIYGGGSFEQEKRISPYRLKTVEGFASPYYAYFMDTPSYESLEQDTDWAVYNGRGFKEMANQPTALSGSFFKGQIDNILVYEVPELGNFQVTSANGTKASWNLFCGAEAFGLVWAKEPWFTQEWSNHHTVVEQAVIEVRGQKALKFPSFNPTLNAGNSRSVLVENGIIHSFVRLD